MRQEELARELEISANQRIVFFEGTPLRNLYEAVVRKWSLKCDPFAASTFYSIGVAHGIRKERARSKKRTL